MTLVSRIQRYVALEVLTGLAVTLSVILCAILLVDVVEQMRTIGARAELSLAGAFQLTLLKVPKLVEETLPFAVLVASILAFSKLNRTSELAAIRAAGVSTWRFLGPAIAIAVGLGVLSMTVLDPLATRMEAQFEASRDTLLSADQPKTAKASKASIWLRQGDDSSQSVIHGTAADEIGQALSDVEIFVFERSGPEFEFLRRIDARRATLRPGFWQLEDVVESAPDRAPLRQDFLALPTTLEPDTLLNRYASARTTPFWDLPRFIKETRQAGLEEDSFLLKFHTLLAKPVLLAAMALIGAIVCLRMRRSGGVSQLIGAGAGGGFLLFFVTQLSEGLAASGAVPAQAAAWCPPLFALFAVLTVIAYAEDG